MPAASQGVQQRLDEQAGRVREPMEHVVRLGVQAQHAERKSRYVGRPVPEVSARKASRRAPSRAEQHVQRVVAPARLQRVHGVAGRLVRDQGPEFPATTGNAQHSQPRTPCSTRSRSRSSAAFSDGRTGGCRRTDTAADRGLRAACRLRLSLRPRMRSRRRAAGPPVPDTSRGLRENVRPAAPAAARR